MPSISPVTVGSLNLEYEPVSFKEVDRILGFDSCPLCFKSAPFLIDQHLELHLRAYWAWGQLTCGTTYFPWLLSSPLFQISLVTQYHLMGPRKCVFSVMVLALWTASSLRFGPPPPLLLVILKAWLFPQAVGPKAQMCIFKWSGRFLHGPQLSTVFLTEFVSHREFHWLDKQPCKLV